MVEEARAAGDKIAKLVAARLAQLGTLVEIRRFDIFADEIAVGGVLRENQFSHPQPNSSGSCATVVHPYLEELVGERAR